MKKVKRHYPSTSDPGLWKQSTDAPGAPASPSLSLPRRPATWNDHTALEEDSTHIDLDLLPNQSLEERQRETLLNQLRCSLGHNFSLNTCTGANSTYSEAASQTHFISSYEDKSIQVSEQASLVDEITSLSVGSVTQVHSDRSQLASWEQEIKLLSTHHEKTQTGFTANTEPTTINASPSTRSGPTLDSGSEDIPQSDRGSTESQEPSLSSTYLAGQSSSPTKAVNQPSQPINVYINIANIIGDISSRTSGRRPINVYIGTSEGITTYAVQEAPISHFAATEHVVQHPRPSPERHARSDTGTDYQNERVRAIPGGRLMDPTMPQQQQPIRQPQMNRGRVSQWIDDLVLPATDV